MVRLPLKESRRRAARPSPRRQLRRQRAQATCDAILTATARILIRDGYEATSTHRIAQEAGVSIGSRGQDPPNKEGLVFAVLEHQGSQWLAGFEAELHDSASASLNVAVRAIIQKLLTLKRPIPAGAGHAPVHERGPGKPTGLFASTARAE